jgi:hypothetical protein
MGCGKNVPKTDAIAANKKTVLKWDVLGEPQVLHAIMKQEIGVRP